MRIESPDVFRLLRDLPTFVIVTLKMSGNMRITFTLLLITGIFFPTFAQKKSKKASSQTETTAALKPLHHSVYDFWEEIPEQAVSRNGEYGAFVINPQKGDGHLYLHQLGNGEVINKFPRGYNAKFTYDSRFVVFKIKPQLEKVNAAKRAKKKKDELPKDSLGIYNLATGELLKFPSLISFQLPEKGSGWLAYQSIETSSDSTKSSRKKKPGEENGYTLFLRNLTNGTQHQYPFVKTYTFTENGKLLAFATTASDSLHTPGVWVWETVSESPQNIFKGHSKHTYKHLVFDKAGEQLAYVADLDTNAKTQIREPKLFYWKKGNAEAALKVDEKTQPAGNGWYVSSEYKINFSKNGQILYYGINPAPVVPDTTLLPEEIVNVEVWHWKDAKLQTQQKVTYQADKNRSFLTALDLRSGKSVQLADGSLQGVSLVNEGNASFVLVNDPTDYSHEHWDWNPKSDVYVTNVLTGERKLVRKKLEGRPIASPLGKYVYWFSNPDTAWFAYSVEKGTLSQLTHNRIVRFADEEDDHPDFPNSYGVAGWTGNDEKIILYDRYDLWLIDPENPEAKTRLTQGREQKIRYRYVKLDPEERHINLSSNLLLRSFNENSKQEGFYSLDNSGVKARLEGDFRIGQIIHKAEAADRIIFTKETFRDFPNWHSTTLSFEKLTQITYANPQQKEYLWGTVELVSWNANDGTPLQGLLYKPDNFDPSKKYPMMTYFYEKNSDNLHTHFAPKPIRSYINFSYFTSNGYVVFVPDIVYQIGYPGHSAYNCVIPGVQKMIETGYIDKDRIGVSGHSWGGYQTAYLVTRTNLFRAAEAGAPVSNMTSAYGGVRWDTGLVRQAQYERTQSRIGGTLWEKPLQFIENSPLFFADRVETPVLMMHNDADGAVPWYQGIEFYLALKRLNKPVWMLNYVGEKHGLTQRQNMTDFAIRLYQFFDHYLKDQPMPRWMATGLPYVEKGVRQGLELVTEE